VESCELYYPISMPDFVMQQMMVIWGKDVKVVITGCTTKYFESKYGGKIEKVSTQ
jgi:hypothetical protein